MKTSPIKAPPPPKYHRLANVLRTQIEAGTLAPGAQMPSEPTLCAEHGLSRGTVRQAIGLLVDEGLLVREQGRGTFVAAPASRSQHFSLASFADEMRRQRRQPSTRLLVNEQRPAPPLIAERLALAPQTPVLHIQRLRLADGQPVAVESRYLAHMLCPQLANEDLERQSIHWLLVHKYAIPLVRMEHVVELRPLAHEVATLLRAPVDAAAFHVERLTFTTDEAGDKVPAVWFEAVYSQENYHLHTQTI